jgi:hypothetical protein
MDRRSRLLGLALAAGSNGQPWPPSRSRRRDHQQPTPTQPRRPQVGHRGVVGAMSGSATVSSDDAAPDFSGLRALFVNGTLKRSPEVSNTQALVDASAEIMVKHGVTVETVRLIDHDVATGVWPDMTEHGWKRDAWPAIQEKV